MAQKYFPPPQHYGMGGGNNPRVAFDDSVPAGVDPDALWRKQNSQRQRRMGTTPAERAGQAPGYTPGYGRIAVQNGGMSDAQWDETFHPERNTAANVASGAAVSGTLGLPPSPAPAKPVGIPSPGQEGPPTTPQPATLPPSPGTMDQHAAIQLPGANGDIQRAIPNLPPGQYAQSSFVPGQNSPANLAKRDLRLMPNAQVQQASNKGKVIAAPPSRPPVDPYA